MATIEERAYEKALNMLKPNAHRITTQELLVEFGKEQRKIDIEKACKWLRKEFDYAVLEYIDRKCKELRIYMEK